MDVSKRVRENIDFLRFLASCNPNQRKTAIKYASKEAILALVECCINVLHGTIELPEHNRKRLKKHRVIIRNLSRESPLSKRRKILVQKGGFLPFLLAPLLSIVSSVAGSAISRAINR